MSDNGHVGQTPPLSLQEAAERAEQHANQITDLVRSMKKSAKTSEVEAGWADLQSILDECGDLLGMSANTLMTVAPREYFPRGWADVFDAPGDVDPTEDEPERRYEFDPHDPESRENVRLAVHACTDGADFDPVRFAQMFSPPEPFPQPGDTDEEREKASENLTRFFWNELEGLTAGEVKMELDAAGEALDIEAAEWLDFAYGERQDAPALVQLYAAAWRSDVYSTALRYAATLTLGSDGFGCYEDVMGEEDTDKGPNLPPRPYEQRLRAVCKKIGGGGSVTDICERAARHTDVTGNRIRKDLKKRFKDKHGFDGRLNADTFAELVDLEAERLGIESGNSGGSGATPDA